MVVCKDLFERMSEYIDGELDLVTIEEAERHLGHCVGCKETLETFKRSISLLKKSKKRGLPEREMKRLKELIRIEADKLK